MKAASQLPAAAPLTGDESIWADQGPTTVKVTPGQIKTFAAAGLATVTKLRGLVDTKADLPPAASELEGDAFIVEEDEDHGGQTGIYAVVDGAWAYLGKFTVDLSGAVKLQSATTQVIDSDLALAVGRKFLGTAADGTQHELAGLNEYEGGQQVEVGTGAVPLCLNHREVPDWSDKHIAVNWQNIYGDESVDKLAYLSDLPAKAGAAEAQAGTDSAKYLVSSVLAAWWSWLKTQALTLTSTLTVGGNATLNGTNNVAPNQTIPLPNDGSLVTKAALRSELPAKITFSAPVVEMTAGATAVNDFGARAYKMSWSAGSGVFFTRELYAMGNADNVMFGGQRVSSTLIVQLKSWLPAVNDSYYKLRFAWGYDTTLAGQPCSNALAWVEFFRAAPDSQVIQMIFGCRDAAGVDHVSAPVDASGAEGLYLSEARYPTYRFVVVPDAVNLNAGVLHIQIESGYGRSRKNFSFAYENIKAAGNLAGFAIEQVADQPAGGGWHQGLSILNVQWLPYAAKLN
jgi:hypothetical protein